ncbi:hypothetical protein [Cetobacterium sp.]|uniref:hypothetical protein n=1 Tax=Cetobacterium sp. TaxID=2071632 RepID=UPI003F318AEF
MWKCKECKTELIAVYNLQITDLWGKVNKNIELIELDDMENDRVLDKDFQRTITKFTCNCDKDITSQEDFEEKAEWVDE